MPFKLCSCGHYPIAPENEWGLCGECALLKIDDLERRRWNRDHGFPEEDGSGR